MADTAAHHEVRLPQGGLPERHVRRRTQHESAIILPVRREGVSFFAWRRDLLTVWADALNAEALVPEPVRSDARAGGSSERWPSPRGARRRGEDRQSVSGRRNSIDQILGIQQINSDPRTPRDAPAPLGAPSPPSLLPRALAPQGAQIAPHGAGGAKEGERAPPRAPPPPPPPPPRPAHLAVLSELRWAPTRACHALLLGMPLAVGLALFAALGSPWQSTRRYVLSTLALLPFGAPAGYALVSYVAGDGGWAVVIHGALYTLCTGAKAVHISAVWGDRGRRAAAAAEPWSHAAFACAVLLVFGLLVAGPPAPREHLRRFGCAYALLTLGSFPPSAAVYLDLGLVRTLGGHAAPLARALVFLGLRALLGACFAGVLRLWPVGSFKLEATKSYAQSAAMLSLVATAGCHTWAELGAVLGAHALVRLSSAWQIVGMPTVEGLSALLPPALCEAMRAARGPLGWTRTEFRAYRCLMHGNALLGMAAGCYAGIGLVLLGQPASPLLELFLPHGQRTALFYALLLLADLLLDGATLAAAAVAPNCELGHVMRAVRPPLSGRHRLPLAHALLVAWVGAYVVVGACSYAVNDELRVHVLAQLLPPQAQLDAIYSPA